MFRAREENLLFGLDELRHLYMVKRNNQSLETFLMSPRPGRHVIGGSRIVTRNGVSNFCL